MNKLIIGSAFVLGFLSALVLVQAQTQIQTVEDEGILFIQYTSTEPVQDRLGRPQCNVDIVEGDGWIVVSPSFFDRTHMWKGVIAQ